MLGEVLARRLGRAPLIASSYGYVAPSSDPRVVMEVLAEAVERAGCADVMAFALDCASSEVYDKSTQTYAFNGERVTAEALIDYARALSEDFPMVFIEDLLDGDDWDGFTKAAQTIDRSIIVGDDLIVTNRDRLERAVKTSAVDGFIMKPNQVGTIAEALDCFEYAAQQRDSDDPVGPVGRCHRRCRDGPGGRIGGAVSEKRRAAVGRAHREAQLPAARGRTHPQLRARRLVGTGAVLSASAASHLSAKLPAALPRTPPTRSKVRSSQHVSAATGPPRSDRCRRGR